MGMEIRRVPKDWKHPKDERGHYKPLNDIGFETKAREWLNDCLAWDNGTHPDLKDDPNLKSKYPYYWRNPPDEEYCRPEWTSDEATHYQIYENVSEGTPVSPIFESLDEMKAWLNRVGFAFSMVATPSKGVSGLGIHS